MDYLDTIRKNIIGYRKLRGLRQRDLAKMIHKGQSFISQVENGQSSMDLETFFSVCQALDVSPDELSGRVSPSGSFMSQDDERILEAYHRLPAAERPAIRRALGLPEVLGEGDSATGDFMSNAG